MSRATVAGPGASRRGLSAACCRMRAVEVVVLPELCARDSLRAARLHSLDPLRGPTHLYVSTSRYSLLTVTWTVCICYTRCIPAARQSSVGCARWTRR